MMVMAFWDREGVIFLDVMQRETTVNSDTYISMLKKRSVLPEKNLRKMLLEHNNARFKWG